MQSRMTFYGFVVTSLLFQSTLHAEWVVLTAKRYQHMAVGESIVLANSHEPLLRLDLQGNVIEHFSSPVSSSDGMASRKRTAKKILDDFGFRDIDQDSQRARLLLEEEQTLTERRNAPTWFTEDRLARNQSFRMAMDGNQLWTATSAGLFQWAFKQPRQILKGHFESPLAIASANNRILLAAGVRLIFLDQSRTILWDRSLAHEAHRVTLSTSGKQAAWLVGVEVTWWRETKGVFDEKLPLDFVMVSDIAFCGETLLVLNGNQLVAISEDGLMTRHVLPQSAHQIACMTDVNSPWVLQGKDLLRSADGGTQWQAFPLPPFTRIRDMAVTPSGAFVSSSEGLLYCPWNAWSNTLPTRAGEGGGERKIHSKISQWQGYLPRVTLHGQLRQTPGNQDFRTLLLATFPLDQPAHILAADNQERRGDERGMPLKNDLPMAVTVDGIARELPCLHQTRRQAIEMFLVEPERARSYLRRSAHAAWLPELRVMIDRRYGRSESLDYVPSTAVLSSPLGVDTVNDVRYEARATWDLAKLVFSPEELAAQSQAIRMAEQRRDLELSVHRLFFERQRLRQEHVADAVLTSRRFLRLSEISAELDAISGNTFSECLAKIEQGVE